MSNPRADSPTAQLVDEYAHLLSLAAHEFRTPASVVAGYLRMLQKTTETPLTERQRKMVDEAAKACGRLVDLIDELSEIGKLDSGRVSAPSAQTFDLFELVGHVAVHVQHGEDREVRIQPGGAESGARISAERGRLEGALASILRALVRELPTATTLVCDRRTRHDGDADAAVVVIARDTDVQRAYDSPWRPFDEARGGVGLALPIARRLIEQAGGRLWSPTPDDGHDRALRSAAVVSLPLRK
jgi:signal transduction histidine kinase